MKSKQIMTYVTTIAIAALVVWASNNVDQVEELIG